MYSYNESFHDLISSSKPQTSWGTLMKKKKERFKEKK